MRATLHLISAGLLGVSAVYAARLVMDRYAADTIADTELGYAILFALTAIANLIYAFKD